MDFRFTEEQEAFRQTIRKFIKNEFPRELDRELDEKEEYPHELYQKMAELGFMGLPFPEEYGGSGGDVMDFVIICEELARGGSACVDAYLVSVLFGGEIILINGSEEQKKHYLPKIASGEIKCAMALTEPDAGSDAASVKTTAVREGDKFILNGTKMFITGAHVADYIMTVAITDRERSRYKNLSMFLVKRESKGLTTNLVKKLGSRAVGSNEIILDDVEVSIEDIVGGPEALNRGWNQVLRLLDVERIVIAACSVGGAQVAFDDALEYSKQRVQFGQPVGKFQINQHKFATMATEIQCARLLTYYAAWLKNQGKSCSKEASMAKYYATDVSKKTAIEGLQIMGGYGYTMEFDMQRYLRSALLAPIIGGTNEIQKNIIARFLGL